MKTKLLIICLLASINCFAQKVKSKSKQIIPDKPINTNGFLGIGVFKLGSDTTELMNFAQMNVDEISDCTNSLALYAEMKSSNHDISKLFRLKKGTGMFNSALIYTHCPDVNEYFLSEYIVSGISIKHVRLTYYKNKLVQFESDYSHDIVDALTVKYGKSNLVVNTTNFSCMHNFTGIATPLEEKTFSSEWYNGTITAYSVLYDKYDEHCNKSLESYFMYSIKNKAWRDCEDQGLDDEIKKDMAPKVNKKQLNDF